MEPQVGSDRFSEGQSYLRVLSWEAPGGQSEMMHVLCLAQHLYTSDSRTFTCPGHGSCVLFTSITSAAQAVPWGSSFVK